MRTHGGQQGLPNGRRRMRRRLRPRKTRVQLAPEGYADRPRAQLWYAEIRGVQQPPAFDVVTERPELLRERCAVPVEHRIQDAPDIFKDDRLRLALPDHAQHG